MAIVVSPPMTSRLHYTVASYERKYILGHFPFNYRSTIAGSFKNNSKNKNVKIRKF